MQGCCARQAVGYRVVLVPTLRDKALRRPDEDAVRAPSSTFCQSSPQPGHLLLQRGAPVGRADGMQCEPDAQDGRRDHEPRTVAVRHHVDHEQQAAHCGGCRSVRTKAGARLLHGPHQLEPLLAEVAGRVQLVGGAAAVGGVHGVLDDGPGPARERDQEPRGVAGGRVDPQQQGVDAREGHAVHDQRPLRARRLAADRLAQAMEAVAEARHGGWEGVYHEAVWFQRCGRLMEDRLLAWSRDDLKHRLHHRLVPWSEEIRSMLGMSAKSPSCDARGHSRRSAVAAIHASADFNSRPADLRSLRKRAERRIKSGFAHTTWYCSMCLASSARRFAPQLSLYAPYHSSSRVWNDMNVLRPTSRRP